MRILSEDGEEITEPNVEGYMALKLPGPLSLIKCFWENDYEHVDEAYLKRFPGYFFNGEMGMWDKNGCYQHLRRTNDIVWINYKKTSYQYLVETMNKFPGVDSSMIIGNLKEDKAFSMISTKKENWT